MTRDRALLAASTDFAGACMFGSLVAVRQNVPGEPFGIASRFSVRFGVLLGWGSWHCRAVADAAGGIDLRDTVNLGGP